MINTKAKNAEGRATRLRSFTNFDGNLESLVQCSACKTSKCGSLCGRGFNQSNTCSNHTTLITLSNIEDIVIVDHSPIGCSASTIYMNSLYNKRGKKARGWPLTNLRVFSTNMNETDGVFGATGKLRMTILAAYERHHPSGILVTASCVSGIIGEDITSVTDELAEMLQIPIIPVFCEGLKSKIWADGFDAGQHALLKYVVKEPEKKSNKVNFINFYGGVRKKVAEMLNVIGLEPQFVANFATIEELSRISEATATVNVCGTLGTYLGAALEEKYGVPYLGEISPHGIKNYEAWYRSLAALVGKEAEAEEYLRKERERCMPEIEKLREKLAGTRAVLGMGPGFAFNYIEVMEELNITVEHVIGFHYDRKLDGNRSTSAEQVFTEDRANIKTSICDLQNHEILRILNEIKPDVFINRHNGVGGDCMKLGIPLVFLGDEYSAFGYDAMVAFGNRILDTITNRNLVKNISKHTRIPYKRQWIDCGSEEN